MNIPTREPIFDGSGVSWTVQEGDIDRYAPVSGVNFLVKQHRNSNERHTRCESKASSGKEAVNIWLKFSGR